MASDPHLHVFRPAERSCPAISRTSIYKLILVITLSIVVLPFLSPENALARANVRTLTVGVYENAPKVFTDKSGKPAGIFIDILEHIAENEGWKLRYVPGTWGEGLDRLEKGEIDLMPDVAYTAERARIYAFPRVPVLSSWYQVYAPKGNKIQSIFDLNGKRVLVLEHSVQQAAFVRLSNGFGLHCSLISVPDYKTMFEMVAGGKADAAITNRFYGKMHANKFGLEDTAVVFEPSDLFFAASRQVPEQVLDTLDRYLAELKKDPQSVYYASLKRWTSEEVRYKLPAWLKMLGFALGAGLVVSLVGSSVLKHQINARTRELKQRNQEMEQSITERKQTEEALRESEGKYRTLVENIPQKIFTKDSRSVYLSCNENYARDRGITPDEIAGKTDFDFFPKELAEKYRADDRRIMDSGKTEGIEEQYIQDGKKIWIYTVKTPIRDKAGDTIGILGVFSDITERKRAEEALQNSKTFLDNVIEQSPYSIWISDDKGVLVRMNQACRDLLHISDEDVIGKYNVLEDNIVREQGLMPLVEQVFRRGRLVRFNLVYDSAKLLRPTLKDTTSVVLDVTIFPIKDINGKVTNAVIQHIDITERKQAEEEREKLHAQLLQSQKMEAVGLLAGGIAHDFNNILTAMIGYGHILKMKLGEEDPLRSYADHILTLSDKAANLTQNLLAFSRKQIINPRPVDLNSIIRKLDHWLSRIIPEDIRLQTTLSEKDLIAMADSGQIEQVLMNLATNARDAMPEGGLLTIRTEQVDIDQDFIKEHGFGREGPYALITLTDTGAGMDREIREKIFEPFFTTKEVGKGTGLGLAMVYGIIKQHEGSINVYSEPGRGTTFRIYLPLIGVPAEEIERDEIIPPDATGTETLLLAEDETEVRKFTRNLLEEYGYTIITATDGQDAIHQFVAHKSEIQLVLLDVIMPLKNGREVYDEINRIKPGLKVLFMSGYPADVIHRQGILEKGFDYIEKPASPARLLRKIRKILDA